MFKKKVTPLNYDEIQEIVTVFIKDLDPELHNMVTAAPGMGQQILMGSAYWTLIQTVDNFLAGKYNPELYSLFMQMEEERSSEIVYSPVLPLRPSDTKEYNLQFTEFMLNLRPLEDKVIHKILRATGEKIKRRSDHMSSYDSLISFVDDCVSQLQFYEGQIGLSSKDKQALVANIEQNQNLLRFYLSVRPDIQKHLKV